VLISYSDEGHIPLDELHAELESLGSVELVPLEEVGRYRPNKVASTNGAAVTEYLIVLQRNTVLSKKAVNE
jgi:adenine-specific DNA-methyltransferase